jgi:predicted O-methyltransferase YrrM
MDNVTHSTIRRTLAVAYALACRPKFIPAYLSSQASSPLDIGMPWISFDAIHFLESYLRPQMEVFEFGSGGSTIFFSKRCARVLSVESDLKWAERTKDALDQLGAANATVKYYPIPSIKWDSRGRPFLEDDGFGRSEYFKELSRAYDVVFIDGADDFALATPFRESCYRSAELLMPPGSIIVLDDAWAYPRVRSSNRARKRLEFKGIGPCRKGITSTDVFLF